jgi:hypothetical protein
MTVDLAYITDIASEFATVDSSRIDRLVAIFELQVPAAVWGDRRDLAVAYLVCHALKVDANRGGGSLTQEKIGDLSRSFGQVGGVAGDAYDLTSYGKQFKIIRSQLVTTPFVT